MSIIVWMSSVMVLIGLLLIVAAFYFSKRICKVYSCFELLDAVEVLFKRDRLEHLQAWLQEQKANNREAIRNHKADSVETISVFNRFS